MPWSLLPQFPMFNLTTRAPKHQCWTLGIFSQQKFGKLCQQEHLVNSQMVTGADSPDVWLLWSQICDCFSSSLWLAITPIRPIKRGKQMCPAVQLKFISYMKNTNSKFLYLSLVLTSIAEGSYSATRRGWLCNHRMVRYSTYVLYDRNL